MFFGFSKAGKSGKLLLYAKSRPSESLSPIVFNSNVIALHRRRMLPSYQGRPRACASEIEQKERERLTATFRQYRPAARLNYVQIKKERPNQKHLFRVGGIPPKNYTVRETRDKLEKKKNRRVQYIFSWYCFMGE